MDWTRWCCRLRFVCLFVAVYLWMYVIGPCIYLFSLVVARLGCSAIENQFNDFLVVKSPVLSVWRTRKGGSWRHELPDRAIHHCAATQIISEWLLGIHFSSRVVTCRKNANWHHWAGRSLRPIEENGDGKRHDIDRRTNEGNKWTKWRGWNIISVDERMTCGRGGAVNTTQMMLSSADPRDSSE